MRVALGVAALGRAWVRKDACTALVATRAPWPAGTAPSECPTRLIQRSDVRPHDLSRLSMCMHMYAAAAASTQQARTA